MRTSAGVTIKELFREQVGKGELEKLGVNAVVRKMHAADFKKSLSELLVQDKSYT